ncbi:hypothetical protein NOF04DRAFT_1278872 [Fusarium oxysporum II5]|nr:hypothetical protein NOF04DRAFT_1278872 [Fusarium oxysporum II5]
MGQPFVPRSPELNLTDWTDLNQWYVDYMASNLSGSASIYEYPESPLIDHPITNGTYYTLQSPSEPNAIDNKPEIPSNPAELSLLDCFRYPCPYSGCSKTFKRKEHAKRHYITKHETKRNQLVCEFCGKNTFTRRDNLNAHRRLHARGPTRFNTGVHFVPAVREALQNTEPVKSFNGTKIGIRCLPAFRN